MTNEQPHQRPSWNPALSPLVWTRRWARKDNIIVMTADAVAVSTLPARRLEQARRSLEYGEDLFETLGSTVTYVQFATMTAIHATMNRNDLVFEHEKSLHPFVNRVRMPSGDAQMAALEACERRWTGAKMVQSRPNRFLYALKPFNIALTLLLLAGMVHYFTLHTFELRERNGTVSWYQTVKSFPKHYNRRMPSVVEVAAAAGMFTTGILLDTLDYRPTMFLLLGSAAVALLWAFLRLLRPPLILTLVSSGPATGELEMTQTTKAEMLVKN